MGIAVEVGVRQWRQCYRYRQRWERGRGGGSVEEQLRIHYLHHVTLNHHIKTHSLIHTLKQFKIKNRCMADVAVHIRAESVAVYN